MPPSDDARHFSAAYSENALGHFAGSNRPGSKSCCEDVPAFGESHYFCAAAAHFFLNAYFYVSLWMGCRTLLRHVPEISGVLDQMPNWHASCI